ncbi:MAG: DtxR family transcriptional regulator [Verrucomicrobia bacterium]|nr:DtxR family transcriptional regulator [Kiritimatiellia bacterium]MCP5487926.1 DtxR family transcriptional regulator [Verrucomicrobiota bacterium]
MDAFSKSKVELEDALKHLLKAERAGRKPGADSLAGALGLERNHAVELLARLSASGLVDWRDDGYVLTRQGRSYAMQMIRAHRLYETYLADQTGVLDRKWHAIAETEEHRIGPEALRHMEAALGYPRFDPHGDPIPSEEGELPALAGVSLINLADGAVCRVVHVEDEPEKVFDRIADYQIAAGVKIEVVSRNPSGMLIKMEGIHIRLDEPMAANITVQVLPESERPDPALYRLSTLGQGEAAEVDSLSPACRGAERNRLLDLGVVAGASIRYEYAGPSGYPVAYRIRGALMALRREQTDRILVRREKLNLAAEAT